MYEDKITNLRIHNIEKAVRIIVTVTALMVCFCVPFISEAEETETDPGNPIVMPNLYRYFGRNYSYLTLTDSGYMRVAVDGDEGGLIYIEYYSKEFKLQRKKTIKRTMKYWGGFYAGEKYYYLLEGAPNPNESNDVEIIRVTKYDKNWKSLGVAHIYQKPSFGGIVNEPFERCDVDFAEVGNKLYAVTGHSGDGHQGYLEICVNTDTMTGEIIRADLWHSFAQCITKDDQLLYILEMSEGSRCTQLTREDTKTGDVTTLSVLPYIGERTSSMAVATYSSVDDVTVSGTHVLGLATGPDPYNTECGSRNVYLTLTPKDSFTEEATTVKWLTSHDKDHTYFTGNYITKISDDRFLVTWQEYEHEDTIHCMFLDGEGNPIGKEFTVEGVLSECHPIYDGKSVVFFSCTCNTITFFSIDAQSGKLDKTQYRVAGEHATWSIKNGTLTISGTGPIQMDDQYVISTLSYDSLLHSETRHDAWDSYKEDIKKIVVSDGITYIPERCFSEIDQLKEAIVGKDVKMIDDYAFGGSKSLEKLTINSAKTKLGEDVLWVGSFWVGSNYKVVYATLWCYPGSEAYKYAKKNNIRAVLIDWVKKNGKWHYLYKGKDVVGLYKISKADAEKSSRQTSPGYYYFNKKGELQTGWIKVGNKRYYATKKGLLKTGKVKIGKKYYYFSPVKKTLGQMQTGKIKIGKKFYYFSPKAKTLGQMQTGKIKIGKKYYYFSPKAKTLGQMQSGWVKISGKSYYFSPKAKSLGQMVTGKLKIGKKVYKFNAKGVCLNK